MHPLPVLQLLLLLAIANGTPILANKLLGRRAAAPLDGGLTLWDGRPLFGVSKTWRGVGLALLCTAVAAPALGVAWQVGLGAGLGAMAGDLLSSFLKRRANRAPSSQALGLDQVPESLLPALLCQAGLGLTALDILAVIVLFFAGELILSRQLYRWHLRDRPY